MTDIRVTGGPVERGDEVLTPDALELVASLHRRFGRRRDELLGARRLRRSEIAATGRLDFLDETVEVRAGDWTVAEAPPDLRDRRVEITGPTERKMAINALNSGACVWLADLEDANTPHWHIVTPHLLESLVESEYERLRERLGDVFDAGQWPLARQVFVQTALDDDFVDFLTLPAYDLVVAQEGA